MFMRATPIIHNNPGGFRIGELLIELGGTGGDSQSPRARALRNWHGVADSVEYPVFLTWHDSASAREMSKITWNKV